LWYAIAWEKSPSESYAFPRFPYAVSSPARSPTSLAIVRCCVWYAIAWEKSPSAWYTFPSAFRIPLAMPGSAPPASRTSASTARLRLLHALRSPTSLAIARHCL